MADLYPNLSSQGQGVGTRSLRVITPSADHIRFNKLVQRAVKTTIYEAGTPQPQPLKGRLEDTLVTQMAKGPGRWTDRLRNLTC